MVRSVLWLPEFGYILSIAEEVEGRGEMLYKKNYEIVRDDEKGEPKVMQIASTCRKLVSTILQRHMKYLGHVLRGINMENVCLQGTIEGIRARGRLKSEFMNGINTLL